MRNMDEIKKKYWKGNSELDEEQSLKKYFNETDKSQIENEYFTYLENKRKEKLNDPDFDKKILRRIKEYQGVKRSFPKKMNWQIAAAAVILFSIGVLLVSRQMGTKSKILSTYQTVVEDTFDDPQLAYEETKKALLLLSNNLNKGNEYATELVKFSQSQEILKKNN